MISNTHLFSDACIIYVFVHTKKSIYNLISLLLDYFIFNFYLTKLSLP